MSRFSWVYYCCVLSVTDVEEDLTDIEEILADVCKCYTKCVMSECGINKHNKWHFVQYRYITLSRGASRHFIDKAISQKPMIVGLGQSRSTINRSLHRRGSRGGGGIGGGFQWWIIKNVLPCPKEARKVKYFGRKLLWNAAIEALDFNILRESMGTPLLIVCKLTIRRYRRSKPGSATASY